MFILIASIIAAIGVAIYLNVASFSRSKTWLATVTPLASIIGSGFLICGPVLAHEFGGAAALAMMLLLGLAYAIGAVVRYNIAHAEERIRAAPFNSAFAWWARAAQTMLAVAYSISVAYYLKLLAEFCLHNIALAPDTHALISKVAVSLLIGLFAVLAAFDGKDRLEHLAHGTVSLKLGVIAGLLVGLALYWALRWDAPVIIPSAKMSLNSFPMLLGLLVTVQGFETSRYLGHSYDAKLRIRSMKYAQWISSAIYISFLLLLTPFLTQASHSEGVAGILEVMKLVAPFMGALVLVGAASSQLSAAIADTIGSGGLSHEASRGRLSAKGGVFVASGLAMVVVWLTDPFQVVAVASRAFALYYLLQCVIAFLTARKMGARNRGASVAVVLLGLACLAAAIAGAPAE